MSIRWLITLALVGACATAPRPEPAHVINSSGVQRGQATFYDESQMTASGERFNPRDFTAAHRTLPFGTRVRVTNERNHRSVVVRINDRGPFGNARRIIDLSKAAARELHMLDAGVVPVTLEVLR